MIPLALVGLLAGLAAIVIARRSKKARLLLPIAGTVAPGVLLLAASFAPALLGPTYQLSRQRGATAPTGPVAIPIADAPLLDEAPDWVDASRYALQRGQVRVQVVQVAMDEPQPAKERAFHVRVRIAIAPTKLDMKMEPFDWGANRAARPLDGTKFSMPALTDAAGRAFAFRQSAVLESIGGKRRANLFPAPVAEEVMTFAPPPEDWEALHLEVSAAAWGGAGPFRFTIPKSLHETRSTYPDKKGS